MSAQKPLVLVADDEPRITKLVSMILSEEGFRVVTAGSGEAAIALSDEVRPDLIVLDLMMPGLDGFEVMSQLRSRRPVPIILLTARASIADRAKGLDLGADDYVGKPFHPDELAARVRSVLRRASAGARTSGMVAFDDIEIDLDRRLVRRAGEVVVFSRTEWMLLEYLATNPGKILRHNEFLTKIWGPEYGGDFAYLRVWISRLRRKLGAQPGQAGRIMTFQGLGYMLAIDDPAHAGRVAWPAPTTRLHRAPAPAEVVH